MVQVFENETASSIIAKPTDSELLLTEHDRQQNFKIKFLDFYWTVEKGTHLTLKMTLRDYSMHVAYRLNLKFC